MWLQYGLVWCQFLWFQYGKGAWKASGPELGTLFFELWATLGYSGQVEIWVPLTLSGSFVDDPMSLPNGAWRGSQASPIRAPN